MICLKDSPVLNLHNLTHTHICVIFSYTENEDLFPETVSLFFSLQLICVLCSICVGFLSCRRFAHSLIPPYRLLQVFENVMIFQLCWNAVPVKQLLPKSISDQLRERFSLKTIQLNHNSSCWNVCFGRCKYTQKKPKKTMECQPRLILKTRWLHYQFFNHFVPLKWMERVFFPCTQGHQRKHLNWKHFILWIESRMNRNWFVRVSGMLIFQTLGTFSLPGWHDELIQTLHYSIISTTP